MRHSECTQLRLLQCGESQRANERGATIAKRRFESRLPSQGHPQPSSRSGRELPRVGPSGRPRDGRRRDEAPDCGVGRYSGCHRGFHDVGVGNRRRAYRPRSRSLFGDARSGRNHLPSGKNIPRTSSDDGRRAQRASLRGVDNRRRRAAGLDGNRPERSCCHGLRDDPEGQRQGTRRSARILQTLHLPARVTRARSAYAAPGGARSVSGGRGQRDRSLRGRASGF